MKSNTHSWLCLLFFMVGALQGCGRATPDQGELSADEGELSADHGELSADQLARALGLNYWFYEIPPHDDADHLRIELREGDNVKSLGSSWPWPSGERVLVTLRPIEDDKLQLAVIGGDGSFHLSFDDPFKPESIMTNPVVGSTVNGEALLTGQGRDEGDGEPNDPANKIELWIAMGKAPD